MSIYLEISCLHTALDCLGSEALSPTTFAPPGLDEKAIEKFILENPSVLFPEGDLVVVEIKRDKSDIRSRQEPLEWQAIRYASSVAAIWTVDELIEKQSSKFLATRKATSDTSAEELVEEFLEDYDPESFNRREHLVLVASAYDDRTMAACAWLAKNGVPIRCVTLEPYSFEGNPFLETRTILPPTQLEDWFVQIGKPSQVRRRPDTTSRTRGITIQDLLDGELLKPGDEFYVKKAPDKKACLIDANAVDFEGERMSPSQWGMKVTVWPSFSIYQSGYVARTTEKVDALRYELLERKQAKSEGG